MELTGKVIAVLPLQSGISNKNGNEWKKQEYVIQTVNESFPHHLCFNLWGDRIDQFKIQENELITVSFDIDAREYNGRWYNDIRAWKIERATETTTAPMQAAAVPPAFPSAEPVAPQGLGQTESADDDLPF